MKITTSVPKPSISVYVTVINIVCRNDATRVAMANRPPSLFRRLTMTAVATASVTTMGVMMIEMIAYGWLMSSSEVKNMVAETRAPMVTTNIKKASQPATSLGGGITNAYCTGEIRG